MTRSTLVRLQLFALAILTVAVLFRIFGGGERTSGLVVMEGNLEPYRLAHSTLQLDSPTTVSIEAVGSFLDDDHLAAYGWIYDRHRRHVAWKMSPQSVNKTRRTLAVAEHRAVLEPGVYDVYFASYGDQDVSGQRRRRSFANLFRSRSERWVSDASRWKLTVKSVDHRPSASAPVAVHRAHPAEPEVPVYQVSRQEAGEPFRLLRVNRPVRVNVYAVGEILNERADRGMIEYLESGEVKWSFDENNTTHAGGGRRNRAFNSEISLTPGTYRIAWEPHRTTSGWQVNPPFDASGAGLQLTVRSSAEAGAISEIDPWAHLGRFIDLTGPGDNRSVSAIFSVSKEVPVLVYATGEGTGRRMYDYGWIYDNDRGRRVWEMEYGDTFHAGGARKNRAAVSVLRLEPGTYTASFVTDDTHAYGSWNATRPTHPERWGLALFALDDNAVEVVSHDAAHEIPQIPPIPEIPGFPEIDVEAIRKQAQEAAAAALREVEVIRKEFESPASPTRAGEYTRTLVDLTRLPDNVHRHATFRLDREANLHVYALGEIMLSGRFDYGWIEDQSGRRVWEMTRENTRYAGGARKNRKADQIISLPAGTYTAHFKTDDSHAFGSFNQEPPDEPEAWGITIRKRPAN